MSSEGDTIWRRRCGCMRTSEKLKQILKKFPEPPPPSVAVVTPSYKSITCSVSSEKKILLDPSVRRSGGMCTRISDARFLQAYPVTVPVKMGRDYTSINAEISEKEDLMTKPPSRPWLLLMELIYLIQLSVTATALGLYYLIYCYMQLVYFTLRSAVYFHQADGLMKLTIAIVTVTTLVVGVQILRISPIKLYGS